MSIEAHERDAYGFLKDPDSWSEDRARELAAELGVDPLGERHLAVLRAFREHYRNHRAIPPASHLCRELGLDEDCIDELFDGPLNAWQAAGLPHPGEEARIYLDNQTR